MKKRILILFITFNCSLLFATNYYVDKATGSDANDGLSLGTAWKTIQMAADNATAGSTVFIKGGIYYENVDIHVSGTAGNPILFRNYGTDVVILDGTGTSTAYGTTMIRITTANHLEFRNLTIRNLLCEDASGILLSNPANTGITDIKIVNVTVHDIKWASKADTIPRARNNAHPILIYGAGKLQSTAISNILIDSCTVYNNITGYSENISIDGNVDTFIVSNNVVRDNNNIGILAGGNYKASSIPALDHARNGTIRNNKTYNNLCPYSTSSGIYIDGGWDIVVEKNESYNNSYGVEIGCEENGTTKNITVKNNVLYSNENCGIYLGGYDKNTTGQVLNATIRNNTLFQNNTLNDGAGEMEISKASNCVIENNIFYTGPQNIFMYWDHISPQANNTFDYNCWFTPNNNPNNITVDFATTSYSSFSAYQTGKNQDLHSIYANPKFVNSTLAPLDLNIKNISPCIDSGNDSTVISAGETDNSGVSRWVDTIDIGAYEYQLAVNITRFSEEMSSQIFPNPASDHLFITSDKQIEKIILFNEIGTEELSSFTLTDSGLNLKTVLPGMYFIKLYYTDNSSSIHKFVKE